MWHSKVFWIHWGKNALKSVEKKIFWGAWPDFRYYTEIPSKFYCCNVCSMIEKPREKNHSTIAINSVAFGQYTSEKWRFFVPKSTWNIIRVVSLKYFLRNIKIQIKFDHFHIVWKSLKMSHLNFGIFHQFLSY